MGGTPPSPTDHCRPWFVPAAVFLAVAALGLPLIAWQMGHSVAYPLLTIVLDGLPALFICSAACLGGLGLVPLFRLGAMPLRWHLLLGAALGLGSLSLLILLLGLGGFLHRGLWLAILVVGLSVGFLRLRALLGSRNSLGGDSDEPILRDSGGAGRFAFLWIIACPFLLFALLAATNAPGILWVHEGNAYDVLEYHLQMPKEYFQAGGIGYAAHNVYANFPANVEMLYLLAMVLLREDIEAGVTAQMIHLLFAVLAVFAAWAVGRDRSARSGVLSGVVMATTGWLAYLSGLAYVENALLFYGVVAVGVLNRCLTTSAVRERSDSSTTGQAWRWMLLAGIVAGLACGTKYTAVPMIAAPLGLAALVVPAATVRRRVTALLAFSIGCGASFSPWLVKNTAMTGSPVFPLVNTVFDANPEGWGPSQTEQWNVAHSPRAYLQPIGNRARAAWTQLVSDKYQRFGPLLLALAVGGLAFRRWTLPDVVLVWLILFQFVVWLLATHLMARFAVVTLIPMSLLAGRVVGVGRSNEPREPGLDGTLAAFVVLGALWNLSFVVGLHRAESPGGVSASVIHKSGVPGGDALDSADPNAYLAVVNNQLNEDAKVLLIGDARAFYYDRNVDYCVVFNRNPFVEMARGAGHPREIARWLGQQGYTHVLVHWAEVRRLARSYGFAPEVDSSLFAALEPYGVRLVREFTYRTMADRYVSLYVVDSNRAQSAGP